MFLLLTLTLTMHTSLAHTKAVNRLSIQQVDALPWIFHVAISIQEVAVLIGNLACIFLFM